MFLNLQILHNLEPVICSSTNFSMLYDLENANTFYDFYGIQINHEAGSIGISFFRSQFNLVLDYVSTLSFVNEYHNHSSL